MYNGKQYLTAEKLYIFTISSLNIIQFSKYSLPTLPSELVSGEQSSTPLAVQ